MHESDCHEEACAPATIYVLAPGEISTKERGEQEGKDENVGVGGGDEDGAEGSVCEAVVAAPW